MIRLRAECATEMVCSTFCNKIMELDSSPEAGLILYGWPLLMRLALSCEADLNLKGRPQPVRLASLEINSSSFSLATGAWP